MSKPSSDEEDLAQNQDLADIWQKFLTLSRKMCPTLMPSLEKAILTKAGDDFIEITVTENSFYAARLRDKKSVKLLQGVCEQLFKRKMKIRVAESSKKSPADRSRPESDKDRRLKKDALAHPLVADAVEIFRGRVVDVKVL